MGSRFQDWPGFWAQLSLPIGARCVVMTKIHMAVLDCSDMRRGSAYPISVLHFVQRLPVAFSAARSSKPRENFPAESN